MPTFGEPKTAAETLSHYTTYSDEQLVALLNNDDEAAFTEIYNRYWKALYAYALDKIDHDHEEAKEIVQQLFIHLWTRRENLRLKYSLYSYLAAAVRHKVFDIIAARSKKHERELHYKLHIADQTDEISSVEMADMQKHVASLVNALPDRCRLVFRMSREKYKTNKEIARELNVSEKAVESHISLALSRLRIGLRSLFSLLTFFF